MYFYLEYLLQVNKCNVNIFGSLLDSSSATSTVAISGTKTDLSEDTRGSDRESERDRECLSIRPTTLTCSLFVLNIWTRLCASHSSDVLVFSAFAPIRFASNVTISVPSHLSCLILAVTQSWRSATVQLLIPLYYFSNNLTFWNLTGQEAGCEGAFQQTPQKKMEMSWWSEEGTEEVFFLLFVQFCISFLCVAPWLYLWYHIHDIAFLLLQWMRGMSLSGGRGVSTVTSQ